MSDARLAAALGRGVEGLRRRPFDYASSLPAELLEVRTAGGGPPERLLLKDVRAPRAPAVRPGFLVDPLREAEAYLEILAPAGLDVPACRVIPGDRGGRPDALLLELVDGAPLWQSDRPEAWEAAARWLARLHAVAIPHGARRLLRYDLAHHRRWLRRAVDFTGDDALRELSHRFDEVVLPLLRRSPCLVHGEFYPSNVLVERSGGVTRIRPVDWETVGVGPGLLDLAALTSGRWADGERARVTRAYVDALPSCSEALEDDLQRASLLVAIQWLGWSREFAPPAAQRHDWLREAHALISALAAA